MANGYQTRPSRSAVCAREACRKAFTTTRSQQIYCTGACRTAIEQARYHLVNPPSGVGAGTAGAISELLVAADLMRRGYCVFRALSPDAPCDLALLIGDRLLRVEVKSTSVRPDGSLTKPMLKKPGFDLLALCVPRLQRIEYHPPLEDSDGPVELVAGRAAQPTSPEPG